MRAPEHTLAHVLTRASECHLVCETSASACALCRRRRTRRPRAGARPPGSWTQAPPGPECRATEREGSPAGPWGAALSLLRRRARPRRRTPRGQARPGGAERREGTTRRAGASGRSGTAAGPDCGLRRARPRPPAGSPRREPGPQAGRRLAAPLRGAPRSAPRRLLGPHTARGLLPSAGGCCARFLLPGPPASSPPALIYSAHTRSLPALLGPRPPGAARARDSGAGARRTKESPAPAFVFRCR